ncbi:leucine-rich repeat protein [Metasolibacillus fluoroglycofenilyticus]|uniref:leucine-rich repeat protein n=1 Tax=Metasolibacillus fluoroglycofenilyticus TaxID=1239396 RepID=UPI001379B3B2|nr:leucine-rich repeat protein [Metasolibacillus fluoroglycofenilyticus]
MIKKWSSIFIITILIWSQLGLVSSKADGGFLTMTNPDDTLTIIGYAGQLPSEDLVIPEMLFADNIEKRVTAIGIGAFISRGIKSVTIPSSVETIGNSAFQMNNIESVHFELGSNLKRIGNEAFASAIGNDFNKITNIIIPASVTDIGTGAFIANKLTAVEFEEGSLIENIGDFAFGMNEIESIIFPSSLKVINVGAFHSNNLNKIEFKEPMTSITVGVDAFKFQGGVDQPIWYVNGNPSIPWDQLSVTTALKLYTTAQPTYEITFETNGGSVIANETVMSGELVAKPANPTKDSYLFEGWYKDEQLQIPWNFALDRVTENITLYAGWTSPSPFTTSDNGDGTVTITGYIGQIPTDLVIPAQINGQDVIAIGGNNTFMNVFSNKGLTSVIIPEGVQEIGTAAFRGNNLTTLIIPSTIKKIGTSAFEKNQLLNVEIMNGVQELGNNSFLMNNLTNISIPSSVKIIKGAAFAVNELTYVDIAEGVEKIETNAFHTNKLITLVIPSTVIEIQGTAFGQNNLEQVEFKGAVTTIGETAFNQQILNQPFTGWYKDDSLQVPWDGTVASPMTIYSKQLTAPSPFITSDNGDGTVTITGYTGQVPANLVIPPQINGKPVTIIGITAFMQKGLTSVVIPEGVREIKVSAFSGNHLTSITIPSTMQKIADTVFKGNSLGQVEFKGAVTTINGTAFGGQMVTPEFTGWYTNRTMQPSALWDGTVSQAMTIYSVGFPKYIITFNSNGGTNVEPKTVTQGEGIAAPTAPTRAGYTFAGWYKEPTFQTAWNFATDKVTANITLYAKWNVASPNVTAPSTPSTAPAPSTSNQITVNVVDASNPDEVLVQTVINRDSSGDVVKDTVKFTATNASESIEKLANQENKKSRIVIPDEQLQVSETTIDIAQEAAQLLAEGQTSLGIDMEVVKLDIPATSLLDFDRDLYFRIIPVKSIETKQQLEERAKTGQAVQQLAGNTIVTLLGQPMTIETNMQNRPVTLTLPLPNDVTQEQLDNLAVYIEHSDGTKEVVRGHIVAFKEGVRGIQFEVTKFSTFSILYMPQEQIDEQPNEEQFVSKPYIRGYADGTFRPNASVTRAQMASMLARYLTNNEIPEVQASFTDTTKHGAKDAIEYVKAQGLFQGTTATIFNPNGTITRAQMAAVVVRWMEQQGEELASNTTLSFTDVKANHWATEQIAKVNALGIMTGTSDTTFNPEGALTRAQAVKVLNQLFEREVQTSTQSPLFIDVTPVHWAFDDIQAAAQ